MVRPADLAVLPLVAVVAGAGPGCSRAPEAPKSEDRPARSAAADPDHADAEPDTGLPSAMPEKLEVELRRRSTDGDDTVLKLTPVGARYGVARGKARVALRYVLSASDLEPVWETLRGASFDRMQTVPVPEKITAGTSMRVTAGPARYAASTLGRNAPPPEQADAYARCVAAAEALLPSDRGETVVAVRWDASVGDRAAALDIEAGDALLGLHPLPGPRPDADLHLKEPRPVSMVLRHGTPATSTHLTIEAGTHSGVEVAFDPEQDALVLRPWAPPP